MKKIIYILIVVFCLFVISFMYSNKKINSNPNYINKILHNANYYFNPNKINNEGIKPIKQPIRIIDYVFAYNPKLDNVKLKFIKNNNLKVYIYNTHPLEGYLDNAYNVVKASNYLKKELEKLNIDTVVENQNVTSILKNKGLKFKDSYIVSRDFVKQNINKPYDLIIDIHRDALSRNNSYVKINNKNFAKIMLVQNVNYKENYSLALNISNKIKSKYPQLSRGVYNKYVDTFNQDLKNNIVLIELGTNNNKEEEINNSIKVLAEVIGEILNEKRQN